MCATIYVLLHPAINLNFFYHISRTDEDNLLDVSAEIIEETSVKKKPDSPRSYAEDIVRRLSIITPESGRADAVNPSFSNTMMLKTLKLITDTQRV